ncbi:AEC family transporter [Gudongella sp. DL1XJH-153]|uniref:AEC family transporter n=1 Tax=Gudongella sp. DL1XJH-153 TaxID=3409804 RepID=UPI003BB5C7DB
MDIFLYTFFNIIFPIFITIFAGYAFRSRFPIDVRSLVKIQLYLLLPALLFVKVYESELSGEILTSVTLSIAFVMTVIYVLSFVIARLRGYSSEDTSVFINSNTFYNAANLSLPLMNLLYTNPIAVSIQAIIIIVHNIAFFTIGMFTVGNSSGNLRRAISSIFKMPFIYVMITGIIFKRLNMTIWDPIWQSISLLTTTYTGVALLTLGAQLRETNFSFGNMRIYLSNIIRLLLAPSIAFAVVTVMGIEGIVAQVIVIAMGAPTAVNVALMAIEFDNRPEFASQAVLTSTVLSAVTLTLIIIFVQVAMPI